MALFRRNKKIPAQELFFDLNKAMIELQTLSALVSAQINDTNRNRAAWMALGRAEARLPELNELCHRGRDAFGSDLCIVTLMTTEHQNFIGVDGMSEEARREGWEPENTVCKYVITTGTTLHIESMTKHPLVHSLPGCADMGMEAYLSTPWQFEGETVGSYCVLGAEPKLWLPEHVQEIESLASEVVQILS